MTNRNTAPVLAVTIQGILDQVPPGTEVIVVDGGSTDGSVEILRGFGSRIDLVEAGPLTRGAGRERAWRRGTGDVIVQLDTDRPLLPHAFSELVEDYSKVTSSYGEVAMVSEDTAVYPRALMERVGGYDVNLNYGEDREIYDKMIRLNAMVFVEKYYTAMNWSLEQSHPTVRERLVRAFEFARDMHRLGFGFWSFVGKVRETKGLAFVLLVLPMSAAGHFSGMRHGKITDCISPRVRTVEV